MNDMLLALEKTLTKSIARNLRNGRYAAARALLEQSLTSLLPQPESDLIRLKLQLMLVDVLLRQGHIDQARRLLGSLKATVSACHEPALHALYAEQVGNLRFVQSHFRFSCRSETVEDAYREALQQFTLLGDQQATVRIQLQLATHAWYTCRSAAAALWFRLALRTADLEQLPVALARSLTFYAAQLSDQQDGERGLVFGLEAFELALGSGELSVTVDAALILARLLRQTNRLETAQLLARWALVQGEEMDAEIYVIRSLAELGEIAAVRQTFVEAHGFWEAARELSSRHLIPAFQTPAAQRTAVLRSYPI